MEGIHPVYRDYFALVTLAIMRYLTINSRINNHQVEFAEHQRKVIIGDRSAEVKIKICLKLPLDSFFFGMEK